MPAVPTAPSERSIADREATAATDRGAERDQDWAIGVDVGGTKVAGGVVDRNGTLRYYARRDTPDRSTCPQLVEDVIVSLVEELLAAAGPHAHRIGALGVGAAGFVRADRGTVAFSPHLSWRHEPLRERLAGRTRLPITVDNDANAAAWAEYRFGAGHGETHLVLVNLGTGIGGAVVVDGVVQRGRYGLAGEFAHMQVVPHGLRCECGNRGCWEQYASGNALVREARSLVEAHSPMAAELRRRAEEGEGLTGPLITRIAQDGDPMAVELLREVGQWLGLGIANLAAAYDPGMFVIGGGVSAAGELLLAPARESYRRQLTGRGHRPEAVIVAAALGNDAGVVGAADLARREYGQR